MGLSRPTSPASFLDKWQMIKLLGQGSSCEVLLVQDIQTQQLQVLKLFKEKIDVEFCEKEAQIVISSSHPRIITGFDFYPRIENPLLENKECPAIVLEYAPNGDLLQLIMSMGCLPEFIACTYFHQLVEAIEHIHSESIYHLDIKPENAFLDQNYSIKLGDFGLALRASSLDALKGAAGTLQYFAPEMHEGQIYTGYQADLFALGITLFTMVSGNLPFLQAKASDRVYKLIMDKKYADFWNLHEKLMKKEQQFFSSSFRDLIEKMLNPNPKKRLSIENIKLHSWYNGITVSEEKLGAYMKMTLEKKGTSQQSSSNTQ